MEENQWKDHAIHVVQSMPTNTKTNLVFDAQLIIDKFARDTNVLDYALIMLYYRYTNSMVICLVGFSSTTLFTPFFSVIHTIHD